MRSARTLVLKKESLSELTTRELADVAGAAITPNCPTNYCYPSWNVVCRISDILADCPSITGC